MILHSETLVSNIIIICYKNLRGVENFEVFYVETTKVVNQLKEKKKTLFKR